MKRVMVVAHPDDEVLWGAGWILRHPGDWTIYACSIPERDPIRALLFHDACEVLGARGIVLPYVERDSIRGLDCLRLGEFDEIVTHNSIGEYGHRHHKQVHDYITHTYEGANVVTFGFGLHRTHELLMTPEEQEKKLKALQCYSHVLMYAGRMIPKWQALLDRYKLDLTREAYSVAA